VAVDQLNFKNWIEAVQLVRGYQDSHNVSPLGKLGWWTVYSAKQPDKTGPIGGGSMGYNFSQQPDHVVDTRDTHVRPIFEEAAQRLASLGFPRMHSNVVIVNLDDMPNPITGGGVGGYAENKKHGFTVARNNINVDTIIHEHAHMYWFNLPKDSQQYFKTYYQDAVQSDKAASPQDMWAHSGESFDSKGLGKALEESWNGFKEDLERLIGSSLESFFHIQLAAANEDESRLIESTVLTRFGESCMAEAKEEIHMESSLRGGSKVIRPGMHVLVEKFENYIVGWRSDNERAGRYEYPKPLTYDRMHNLVTFKKELLYEKQLEKMKKMTKMASDKPSRFFAPNKKKEEIEELFEDAAKNVARYFTFGGGRHGTTFNADQLFPYPRFYPTWMSRIGRRFKAGKIQNVDGIKQTYIDSMMSQAKGDMSTSPANIAAGDLRKKGYDKMNIGNKEGSNLRNLFHQKGAVPSPYAAANVDELWAVAVEHAAMNRSVSRELKKLIYSTISGSRM
jgi:hypothetical protein